VRQKAVYELNVETLVRIAEDLKSGTIPVVPFGSLGTQYISQYTPVTTSFSTDDLVHLIHHVQGRLL